MKTPESPQAPAPTDSELLDIFESTKEQSWPAHDEDDDGQSLQALLNARGRLLERFSTLRAELETEKTDRLFRLKAIEQVAAELETAKAQRGALVIDLEKYGSHLRNPMCELLRHSDFPCTCGLDAALSRVREGQP